MRIRHSRALAVALAMAAGGLAAFALRPATGTTTATLAARNPAVEVRTQVIQRTIHVIRHEPGARLPGQRGSSSVVIAGHARAKTSASGGHHAGIGQVTSSGVPVATRTSGSHGVSATANGSAPKPVATRTSGSHPSTPVASKPVATRTSGSHAGSPGASGSSPRPVTRSSGAGNHHGDDGGEGHGGDD